MKKELKSEKLLVVRTNPPHIHKMIFLFYYRLKFSLENLRFFAFFILCENYFVFRLPIFLFFVIKISQSTINLGTLGKIHQKIINNFKF